MSDHDDELREIFREAREPDREAAPRFQAMVEAGAEPKRGLTNRWVWRGIAAATVAAAVVLFWPRATDHGERPAAHVGVRSDESPSVAETSPQPDIPGSGLDDPGESEPTVDEDWEVAEWSTPTDFLLERDGVLDGGMPPGELGDPALDLDDEFETREL